MRVSLGRRRVGSQAAASPQNYGYQRRRVNRRSTVTSPRRVTVTRASVREYLATQWQRYQGLTRRERSQLLNEIVAVTGGHPHTGVRSSREAPHPRAGGGAGGPARPGPARVAQA